MTVFEAIGTELDQLRSHSVAPGLAAAAEALAALIDNAHGATAAANAARELRMIMTDLRELAPVESGDDEITKITADREERRLRSV